MAILSQPTADVSILPESGDEAAEIVAMPVDAVPRPKSYLRLSEEREKWLVEMALQEIHSLMREMGREVDGTVLPNTWMAEGCRNQDTYDQDFEWRALVGTVFVDSNLSWNDSGRKARLLSARTRNDLMGTRPFFGCMTARNGRPALTKQVEGYVQERIEASNVVETGREAIRTALVVNQAVVKTSYFIDKTLFRGPAKGILVDANGQPLLTSKGEYVYEKDDRIPDPHVEQLERLKKDPSFTIEPGQYGIADFDELPQVSVKYDNVRAEVCDHRDFLCSLKVNSIHESRANIHLSECTVEKLATMYGDIDMDATRGYFDYCGGRTGATQPIWIRGETEEERTTYVRSVVKAEVYIRCDADEDGREEEVMLILDLTNQRPIFYDYLENHMGERPFSVIPGIEKVAGRWYGVGVMSKMMHADLQGDAQLNRIFLKDGRTASVTIKKKQAVEEWASGAPVEFGTPKIYNYAANYNREQNGPVIERYNLNENAQLDLVLTDKMRQAADLLFGIQSNQSASAMGMNRSDTATGVMSIERDADVITRDQEHDVAKGLEHMLAQAVEMVLENMDEEVLAWSEDGSELVTLNRDEIRSLERQVKLLLTKSRSAEGLATIGQAEAIAMRYFALSPEQKNRLRSLYIKQLQYLEVDDADELLPAITDQEVEAWKQAQANQKPPEKPVSESIAIKLSDLTPDERAQALAKANIQASSPEELEAFKTSEMQRDVFEKRASTPPRPNTESE